MVGLGPTRAGTSQPARTIACSASRYGTICDFGGPGPTPRTWMLPGPGVSKPGSRCDTRSASNRSHDAWRRNVSDPAAVKSAATTPSTTNRPKEASLTRRNHVTADGPGSLTYAGGNDSSTLRNPVGSQPVQHRRLVLSLPPDHEYGVG